MQEKHDPKKGGQGGDIGHQGEVGKQGGDIGKRGGTGEVPMPGQPPREGDKGRQTPAV